MCDVWERPKRILAGEAKIRTLCKEDIEKLRRKNLWTAQV